MNGEVDVRSLFFGVQDFDRTVSRLRVCEWCTDSVGEEVAEVDGEGGDVCVERSKVGVLTLGFGRIGWDAGNSGGEAFDGGDVVGGSEDLGEEGM